MIGNTYTNVNILPQIGYKVTEKLITGVGFNFQYYKNTQISSNPFIIYGGNVFERYHILPTIFLQNENQALSYSNNWGIYGMIGGGFIPSGSGVYISAYYLYLYPSGQNLYGSPYLLRIGFSF